MQDWESKLDFGLILHAISIGLHVKLEIYGKFFLMSGIRVTISNSKTGSTHRRIGQTVVTWQPPVKPLLRGNHLEYSTSYHVCPALITRRQTCSWIMASRKQCEADMWCTAKVRKNTQQKLYCAFLPGARQRPLGNDLLGEQAFVVRQDA
jgi:hypothetical protein